MRRNQFVVLFLAVCLIVPILEARSRAVTNPLAQMIRLHPSAAASVSTGGCTISTGPWPLSATSSSESYFTFVCPHIAWGVLARNTDKGLQIGPVLMQDAKGGLHTIINRANLAELYVPYHTGNPGDRLSDLQFCNAALCTRSVDANDLGPNAILASIGTPAPTTAIAEIRDRGIAWMCKWTGSGGGSHSYRGKEMVISSTWDPGNYDYVIEYSFRDDGQISFRVGATGWDNYTIGTNGNPATADADIAHMHDALWRVDIAINGGSNNSAFVTYHDENALPATDSELPFNGGVEGAMDLDPKRFAALLITDAAVNAEGHAVGYELQPFKLGNARHYAPGEGWTLHDTWVTHYSASEEVMALGTSGGSNTAYRDPDEYLLGNSDNHYGVFNHESVVNQDIVIWHVSSAHHDPHDEDQASQARDPQFLHKGVTLMHWSGFDLVPHNFFDANPLGAPHRADCDGPQ